LVASEKKLAIFCRTKRTFVGPSIANGKKTCQVKQKNGRLLDQTAFHLTSDFVKPQQCPCPLAVFSSEYMSRQLTHILFDNDGTIVDSEVIAQRVMLKMLAEHGFHLSEQEYSTRFPGLLDRDILHILQRDHAFTVPEGFTQQLHEAHHLGFDNALRAIPGMTSLFRRLKIPKSMVSNGSIKHVERCLRKVRLLSAVDGHIFSAEQVGKPKPHPDVYLFALEKIGLEPHHTLAVEDSPTGVLAAKSAGLQVIGFLGAAHVMEGHANILKDAGADFMAKDAGALAVLLSKMGAL
jgi:HAD superfamily hydrolase (TIGR01509 family)